MKLRDFLKCLPFVAVFPVAARDSKQFGKRVFPRLPEEFIGKVAISKNDPAFGPVLIMRQWDEFNDRYDGTYINNDRRDKFWCERLKDKKEVLCYFDHYPKRLRDRVEFYDPLPTAITSL